MFIFVLLFSLIVCAVEVDLSVPSFPAMMTYFGVTEGKIQLTVAYNFLGFCLGSLLWGPLSERKGRRPVMMIGNALLLLGAVGCVLAPSIDFLLGARLIQGIGASCPAVVVFAMIADRYEGDPKAVKLIGIMNAVLTSLMALAPALGGFVNEAVGWRGSYALVALIALLAWLSIVFFLPETKTKMQSGLNMKEMLKMGSDFTFLAASFIPSLLYSAYLVFVTSASFIYIDTYGFSMLEYVLNQGAVVAAFAIVSFLTSGRGRSRVNWGVFLSVLGVLASYYFLTFGMILFAIGFAITYPVVFTASLEIFPDSKGTASSLIMSQRAFLNAAFIALIGYYFDGTAFMVSTVMLGAIIIVLFLTYFLLKSTLIIKEENL